MCNKTIGTTNIHKSFLILFVSFSLLQNGLMSQTVNVNEYSVSNLKTKLKLQQLYIKDNDSLQLEISYFNLSNDTILIIDRIYYLTSSSTLGKNIQIENGGLLSPGSEYKVKLIKIIPLDSITKTIYINSKYLIENSFKDLFGLFMSIGFIDDINTLYMKSNLSTKEIETEGEYYVYASSMVVYASLIQREYTAFYLKFTRD